MKPWFVVRTKPKMEEQACRHLRNQAFNIFLPRYRTKRRHARKVEEVLRPLFPSYLFVQFDPEREPWWSINSTIGVLELVSAKDRPLAVPQDVMDELHDKADKDDIVALRPKQMEVGQPLRVTDGPLTDQVGLLEEMDGTNRAILLMKMLGRDVRVHVELHGLTSVI